MGLGWFVFVKHRMGTT